MDFQGRVRDGVVVLEGEAVLPEGAVVRDSFQAVGVLNKQEDLNMTSIYAALISKIERANQHIEELSAETKSVVESMHYGYRIDRDQETGEQTVILEGIQESSNTLTLSIIAGEVVHQLRSSLDHMICGLVMKNGGNVTRSHLFPVVRVAAEFNAVARRSIKGIPAGAVAAIEKLQPYHHSTPEEHLLSIPNELSNTDKHRNLNIISTVSAPPEYIKVEGNMPGGVGITGYNWVPMKDGAMVLRFKPKNRDAEMHPHFRLTAQIAFENSKLPHDRAVIPLLQQLTEYVAEIVVSFKSELS